ncbi:MAG: hypothetical protein ACYDCC_02750 [Actinomycetota bacterium]
MARRVRAFQAATSQYRAADARKKRVHPARKIVPRGNMSVSWVIGAVIIAGLILLAGTLFLISNSH